MLNEMYDFTDKAVLVTGSTRGIGHAVAELLLSKGATVGVHGRSIDKVNAVCNELSRDGTRTIAVSCDFSDPKAGSRAVRSFFESAGRLDGLVNNAGFGKALAFRGLTIEGWRATFSVNLEAAMTAAREAYIIMREQQCSSALEHLASAKPPAQPGSGRSAGSIVNIASLAAHGPGKWMGADYAASKAGLVSLTRSLAFEAARFGIRVNAISPGMVETDMTSALPEQTSKSLNIPLGRFARPEEIATVAAFLLSDSSAYITGQVLHVDGGLWM